MAVEGVVTARAAVVARAAVIAKAVVVAVAPSPMAMQVTAMQITVSPRRPRLLVASSSGVR
jgi:hypothetical protein